MRTHGALERHALLALANSPAPACLPAGQVPERGTEASGGALSGTHAEDETGTAAPAVPFIPRYPRPIQTFDEALEDTDHKVLVVLSMALAGRAADDLVDAGRLRVWLAVPGPGESPSEAAGRVANVIALYLHHTLRCTPAQTLAAGVRRLLESARCLRLGATCGSVDVFTAGDSCPAGAPADGNKSTWLAQATESAGTTCSTSQHTERCSA